MISGGDGDDVIYGDLADEPGAATDDDIIYGDAGNDEIHGGAGDDLIFGGEGDDVIYGDAGDDMMVAGAGVDLYSGGEGEDKLYFNGLREDYLITNRDGYITVRDLRDVDDNEGHNVIQDVEAIHFYDEVITQDELQNLDSAATMVRAGRGAYHLNGSNGDDLLISSNKSESFGGAKGQDTILFGGALSDYTIDQTGLYTQITDNRSGVTDTIRNAEFLQFDDQKISIGERRFDDGAEFVENRSATIPGHKRYHLDNGIDMSVSPDPYGSYSINWPGYTHMFVGQNGEHYYGSTYAFNNTTQLNTGHVLVAAVRGSGSYHYVIDINEIDPERPYIINEYRIDLQENNGNGWIGNFAGIFALEGESFLVIGDRGARIRDLAGNETYIDTDIGDYRLWVEHDVLRVVDRDDGTFDIFTMRNETDKEMTYSRYSKDTGEKLVSDKFIQDSFLTYTQDVALLNIASNDTLLTWSGRVEATNSRDIFINRYDQEDNLIASKIISLDEDIASHHRVLELQDGTLFVTWFENGEGLFGQRLDNNLNDLYADPVLLIEGTSFYNYTLTKQNNGELGLYWQGYGNSAEYYKIKLDYEGTLTFDGTDQDDQYIGTDSDDLVHGSEGDDVLDAGEGNDTISYANSDERVEVNLENGTATSDGNGEDTLISIENVTGSQDGDLLDGSEQTNVMSGEAGDDTIRSFGGDDVIVGDAGDDKLIGGEGDDIIDGGEGEDYVYYTEFSDGVTVDLEAGTASGASAGNDTLINIERVVASQGDDVITGDANVNYIYDHDGNDVVNAGAGHDRIYGYGGDDILDGGEGNDILYYSSMTDNITVDLAAGTAIGAVMGNDTLINIERVFGSRGDDHISGTANGEDLYGYWGDDVIDGRGGDDTLYGYDDNDTLIGGAGNDTLYGQEGNDTLRGGAGDDHLDGGAGVDTADYSDQDEVLTVDLAASTVSGENSGNDTLVDIERVVGSAGNDTFYAAVNGMHYDGGAGNNRAFYSNVTGVDGVTVDMNAGTAIANDGSGQDTFANITSFYGSDDGDFIYGDDVRNTLRLMEGDDTAFGGGGDDSIYGYGGKDKLFGDAGNDDLHGGDGNDYLYGSEGNDIMDGGAGIDGVYYHTVTDSLVIDLAAGTAIGAVIGTDTLIDIERASGSKGDDTIHGTNNGEYLWGHDGDDYIYGEAGDDTIYGDAGSDRLYGGDGNDTFYGGDGRDYVYGHDGDDTVFGLEGDDHLVGYAGDDTIHGGTGDDTIYGFSSGNVTNGGGGADVLNGGDGNDIIYAGIDGDTVDGGAGEDIVSYYYVHDTNGVTVNLNNGTATGKSGGTQDTLTNILNVYATDFNDHIYGDEAGNSIRAYAGDDEVYAGAGDDKIYGFEGNDTLHGHTGDDYIRADEGNDIIFGGAGDDTIDGGDGSDMVDYSDTANGVTVDLSAGTASGASTGNDTLTDIENVSGTTGDDTVIGDDAHNAFWLQSGDDVAYGGLGNDYINGQDGNDKVYSQEGNDDVEGGDGNDTLYGEEGDDVLQGGEGVDKLIGGIGDDHMDGGVGYDYIYYTEFTDGVVIDFNAGTAVGVSTGNDTFTNIERAFGTRGDDVITGDGNANYLFDEEGDDMVYGGAGNDRFYGYEGDDYYDGGSGSDYLYFSSMTDEVTINLQAGTAVGAVTGNDTFVNIEHALGSKGDDTIIGSDEANYLYGYHGDDVIDGGAGQDTLYGHAGADRFVFSSLTDSTTVYVDRINDFEQGSDLIDVSALGYDSVSDFTRVDNGSYTKYEANDSDFAFRLYGDYDLNDSDFVFS